MNSCCVCRQPVELLLDFGPQPLCNRYLTEPSTAEVRHPLRLGQCAACGLLQLIEPVAATVVKPSAPIWYREPEGHLDQVAEVITALPGWSPDVWMCGVTSKDASLIDRLRQRGCANAQCLDATRDWGVRDPAAGVETLQERIRAGVLDNRAEHLGRYQVVIARHILEHAHSPSCFVEGLRSLLAAGGYLIFEVPDVTRSLSTGDFSTLWEEHVMYFTRNTFSAVLQRLGCAVPAIHTFPFACEDLLIGVTQVAERDPDPLLIGILEEQRAAARRFASLLPAARSDWRQMLERERAAGRPVAMLGAGHLAIVFINLLELQGLVDFVVDDDPSKCGRYLPGARVPICGADALYTQPVRLCLMSVNPANADSVRRRHQRFVDSGGRFVSIFPGS